MSSHLEGSEIYEGERNQRERSRLTLRVLRAILWFTFGAMVGGWVQSHHAKARELTISDQQQQAVYVVCEKAARSPANSLDELVDIGIFCRNWRDLMARNNVAVPPKPDTQEPEK